MIHTLKICYSGSGKYLNLVDKNRYANCDNIKI